MRPLVSHQGAKLPNDKVRLLVEVGEKPWWSVELRSADLAEQRWGHARTGRELAIVLQAENALERVEQVAWVVGGITFSCGTHNYLSLLRGGIAESCFPGAAGFRSSK